MLRIINTSTKEQQEIERLKKLTLSLSKPIKK